jgi:hypothetical protein
VKHQAERHSRGFSSWGQFVAMLFCQLAQAKSLREPVTANRFVETAAVRLPRLVALDRIALPTAFAAY